MYFKTLLRKNAHMYMVCAMFSLLFFGHTLCRLVFKLFELFSMVDFKLINVCFLVITKKMFKIVAK